MVKKKKRFNKPIVRKKELEYLKADDARIPLEVHKQTRARIIAITSARRQHGEGNHNDAFAEPFS